MLALRVFVGIAFWFHGSAKIADLSAFAREFGIPLALATGAAYTQTIGALLLIVGLLTPLAAAALASTMAVATIELAWRGEHFVNPGGHSWEASAFYLIATTVLCLVGAGRWSLDAMVWTRAWTAVKRLT